MNCRWDKYVGRVTVLIWLSLAVAFCLFGLWLNGSVYAQGIHEVFGYDYRTYMEQFRSIDWIAYTGVRHPCLGLIMSPVVVLASLMDKFDPRMCDVFQVILFSMVGVANVWMVKRISGWFGACVFLGFGFVWVLAAVPESFPLAMLTLLAVVAYALDKTILERHRIAGWICLFAICSGVTITNGLKVVIAYLVAERMQKRTLMRCVAFLSASLAVGVCFFYLRMIRWNEMHPDSKKSILVAIEQTLRWMPDDLGVWGRIKCFVTNFIVTPIQPRFDFSELSHPDAPSAFAYVWTGALCCIAAVSAWFGRQVVVVRVLVGMFMVDIVIHLICGWGLLEGWIFCAHWFWMVAILVGIAARRTLLATTR